MNDAFRRSAFADLREALQLPADMTTLPFDTEVRIRSDPNRGQRTGIPEVVHAGNKPALDIAEALRQLAHAQGRALASRVAPEAAPEIRAALGSGLVLEEYPNARAVVAHLPGAGRLALGGVIGVLSAGTSDLPVAAEAVLMAEEMGARVLTAWDVGVAGLHRLVAPLERFQDECVDVIIVAAGMDGALPSVIAGLVNVPVIGLPTSIGYGLGGNGIGALTTMLQSCAPGLVVVNIDNGIGAGATAALIANRAAPARTSGGS